MKDLGVAKQIIRMRIITDKANSTLKISQTKYVKKILSKFSMDGATLGELLQTNQGSVTEDGLRESIHEQVPYASAIRSLTYAMVCPRLDIAYGVGVVSRYMSNLGKKALGGSQVDFLRYLRGTLDTSLCFTSVDFKLQGYVDTDLTSDVDSRKSTTGFIYTLGGNAVCWTSRLQKIVSLSTTEAEYVAVTEPRNEMVWLQGFLDELGKKNE